MHPWVLSSPTRLVPAAACETAKCEQPDKRDDDSQNDAPEDGDQDPCNHDPSAECESCATGCGSLQAMTTS